MRDEKGRFIKGNEGFWLGKKRKPFSEKTRRQMSESRKGKPSPALGRKMSDEEKVRRSQIAKAYGFGLWMKGKKLDEKTKQKLSEQRKGIPKPSETVDKMRQNNARYWQDKRENESAHWKGDEVGYSGLHQWVKRQLGTPNTCEHCKKSGLSSKAIHWANKSQQYKRDLSDWIRLCASCHKKYDMGFKS